jgi:acetate kinase
MAVLKRSVLTINSGSSSLKASLFMADGNRRNYRYEHVLDQRKAFGQLLYDMGADVPDLVGHRFVHGGEISDPARQVDEAERSRLEGLIHLAPLHLPGNLLGLELCLQRFAVPQVVCFDTAFHATMPELAKRLPIPNELGLCRFGFHGLNYAYIAKILPNILGDMAYKKVIVAHLGSGASLCLMENLKSMDTSMGYTPAGGIPMGTRSGDLDPGVMLELAKRYTHEELRDMIFYQMGLVALSSGESSEMNELLSSQSANAKFAVEYFCRQVRGAIGSFAAKAGGIDALVFTGGIGEHSAEVREKICAPLAFLGIALDTVANNSGTGKISLVGNKPVLIVSADEETIIRDLCLNELMR